MSIWRRAAGTLLGLLAIVAPVAAADAVREIAPIRGDLYLVRDGAQATVFLVGPDAILIADPLGSDAARWLRDELQTRFPGLPVKYAVLSNHTFERAAGAGVFRPEATVVAHERFNAALRRAAMTLPASLVPLDRNGNHRLEREEWSAAANDLSVLDADGDGVLTPAEIYKSVEYSRSPFGIRGSLKVGARTVELLNPGLYSSYSTALYFPDEHVLFSGGSLLDPAAFSFGDADPRQLAAWMHSVSTKPFELFVSGRGKTMTRADFDALTAYVDDLLSSGLTAFKAGRKLTEVDVLPGLDKYRGTGLDAQRRANITRIYDSVELMRVDVQAAGLARWLSGNTEYCAGYDGCTSGGRIFGGLAGARVAAGRLGGVVELALGDQILSQRTSELQDDAFELRSSRVSGLVRFGNAKPGARSYDLLAGVSVVVNDMAGVSRLKQGFAPIAGRHPISDSSVTLGFSFGTNLMWAITHSVTVVAPLRFTVTPATTTTSPGQFEVQAGIGFSFAAVQRVR